MSGADPSTKARERLISAAVSVIAEHGYAATTVADVISRASCGRATFYEHFNHKEECLLAALDRVADELLAELRSAIEGARGVDATRSVVSALVDFAYAERAPARVLLLEALGGGPRALARRDRLIAQVEKLIDESAEPARSDRRVLDLPAAPLVGGTFRLLAIRLHRAMIDTDELRSGLLAWIDAYLIPADQCAAGREGFPTIPPPRTVDLSSLREPPPLPPGRHRLDRGEVARNQRERILHATVHAVYQYTFQATTVEDITARAGVSRTVFYHHFRDRQHAAIEAIELFFDRGMTASVKAFFAAPSWPRAVWAAGEALSEFMAANPAAVRLTFAELHAVSPAAVEHVRNRVSAFTLFLEPGYSYRDQNRELPRLLSEALAAVMLEFAYRGGRQHPAAAELPTMLPDFAYTCLAPFLGPDEATDFVQTMIEEARTQRTDEPDADRDVI